MARVTLSRAGEDVFVGGSDVEVFGTNTGGETITVVTGNIRLDPSFNVGGDTIVLPGLATSYTAYRSGSEVILARSDGAVTLRVPFGTAGVEVQFDGGDSRTLLFDTSVNQVTIEGQAVSNSSASPTPLAPAGAIPTVSYDVVGANASTTEGDSGTKVLTFTINLDRAVTGEPLTLNYQTQNGTATAGSDYVAASGTVTIPAGQQSATVSVTVNGDTMVESNETFTLNLTGSQLRNGPETLTGTITNDDASGDLTAQADTRQGSSNNDNFIALNTALGAGDQIVDGSTTDNDSLSLTVNSATTGRSFAGFTLTNVESVGVANTSGQAVSLDLSGATGVKSVGSFNSSDTIVFDQLTSNASVVVSNVSGGAANVQVNYQAGVTAGATTVASVVVTNSTANQIILGTVGAGSTGIETVNLSATGVSSINALATQLTTLNIIGGGDITIGGPLVNSVRTVDASAAGRVTIDFSNNDAAGTGVTLIGSAGADVVRSGLADDTISTGNGNDSVTGEGGNDTINTGAGNDTITLLGAGDVTIDAGADDDTINSASFDGNDVIRGGAGIDTINVTDGLINSAGAFSGIEVINFISDGDGEDQGLGVSDANAPTAGNVLTINAGSSIAGENFIYIADTVTAFSSNVTTGAGTDIVNLRNSVADVAVTGAGRDTVNLGGGDTVSTGAGEDIVVVYDGNNVVNAGDDGDLIQLLGTGDVTLNGDNGNDVFEVLSAAYLSAADTLNGGAGTDTITLNADTYVDAQFTNVTSVEVLSTSRSGTTLTLGVEAQDNGNGIRTVELADVAGISTLDAAAYTFGLTVRSGRGNDVITTGSGGDTVRGGAGNDTINGNGGDDFLYGDIIFADAGSLTDYNAAGGGNDTINGGEGSDVIVGGLGKDVLTGGDGADTFRYYSVEDSRLSTGGSVDNRDTITDFVAGVDKVDLTQLAAAAGQTIQFAGDFATFGEAQAAVASSAGDGFLDVAFVRDQGGQSVLFVDVNNDGQLTDSDLQIVMTNVTGTLTATDVNNPHLVTGPELADGSFGGEPQYAMAVQVQPFAASRFGDYFDLHHIA